MNRRAKRWMAAYRGIAEIRDVDLAASVAVRKAKTQADAAARAAAADAAAAAAADAAWDALRHAPLRDDWAGYSRLDHADGRHAQQWPDLLDDLMAVADTLDPYTYVGRHRQVTP